MNQIEVGSLITFNDTPSIFEVTSISCDGKFYFSNINDPEETYTGVLTDEPNFEVL